MTASSNPFTPLAPTANVAVTGSAQTISPDYSAVLSYKPCTGYLFTILGTVPIFYLFGASPVITVANGIPLQAGSSQTFMGPANSVVQVIAGGVGSTLYVTPGEGV